MCCAIEAPKGSCVPDRTPNKKILILLCALIAWCSGCASKHESVQINLQKLQDRTQDALAGKNGAAVVMDVRSGRVLALVNPRIAAGRSFPVGSALKPLAALAALEQGAASPNLMLPCKGVTSLHGHDYHCWLHGGHGSLDMTQALAQSCNIYFYTLGARINGSKMCDLASRFGFGKTTGMSLSDYGIEEDSGRMPGTLTPELVSRFAAGDTPEFRATPLQMAVFTAALANDGRVFKPERVRTDTFALPQKNLMGLSPAMDSAEALAVVRAGMEQCVTSPLGTCHALANMGYSSAGKTGTARHAAGPRTHAWFIGYTPVDDPEAAVVVFLERGEGGRDAAPAARRIMQAWHQCKIY